MDGESRRNTSRAITRELTMTDSERSGLDEFIESLPSDVAVDISKPLWADEENTWYVFLAKRGAEGEAEGDNLLIAFQQAIKQLEQAQDDSDEQ